MKEKTKTLLMGVVTLLLFIASIFFMGCMIVVGINALGKEAERAVDKSENLNKEEDKTAYDAWVKYTGNKKELTFNEWRALKEANALSKD